jgi:hypothetical protein
MAFEHFCMDPKMSQKYFDSMTSQNLSKFLELVGMFIPILKKKCFFFCIKNELSFCQKCLLSFFCKDPRMSLKYFEPTTSQNLSKFLELVGMFAPILKKKWFFILK